MRGEDAGREVRHAARTDATMGPICRALEQIPGVKVYYLKLPLDLLVGYRGRNFLLECKTRTGTLTKGQQEMLETWPGQVAVVRSPEEALRVILGEKALA